MRSRKRSGRLTALLVAFALTASPIRLSVAAAESYGAVSEAGARPWIGFGEKDNVYCGIDTDEKLIALTFDDGPHPRYTDEILDLLNKYGVRATFFVVGENAVLYENVLKRISDEGHEIGNHTYTHCCVKQVDRAHIKDEITKTENEIQRITGKRPTVFRPPEGCCNKNVVSCASELGYKLILWTVDPRDWASPPVSAVSDNILHSVKSGAIILCHDYNSNKHTPTPQALRIVIPSLISGGYRFVTISELIASAE